jgi:hypothetical protein
MWMQANGQLVDGRLMTAKFPGRCSEPTILCEGIKAGDQIVFVRSGVAFHPICHNANCEQQQADDAELYQAQRERQHENAEYAAGQEDYRRWKTNVMMFGEEYAASEEIAWDMKMGDY